MLFSQLASYFEKIEATRSRLTMTHLLAELFAELDQHEIRQVMYLLQGQILPLYEKIDFGIGEKMVARAAAKALGIDKAMFDKEYSQTGDIGLVVEKFKQQVTTIFAKDDMKVLDVYDKLKELAIVAGQGSQEGKMGLLIDLIQTLDPLSARYVVRIPTQTLRLGFSDMTILDGLSWMLTGGKTLRPQLEKAYQVRPDLGYVGEQVKKNGIKGVEEVVPEVFTPILMMKAQRVPSPENILEKFASGFIEPKYDGFRLQVHYVKKGPQAGIKLYSRGLENVSFMYPDLVAGVEKQIMADTIIFEGEAMGMDPATNTFLPFQETVQRKRKHGIDEKATEIPLKMFAFEILYHNGKSLLNEPLADRIGLLKKIIKSSDSQMDDTILLAQAQKVETAQEIEDIFDDAIGKGLEGVMVKKTDGIYQPGGRGWNWIKYKRSYSKKINDTIDCVVMGYDYGKGKRAGFGIGAFLVGVYDKKRDMFVTLAKIGTGLKDTDWHELKTRCDAVESATKPTLYDTIKIVDADVWVTPHIVVEIKADEITKSPAHTAGMALRFPRLSHFRDDKLPTDATTFAEVQKMFADQTELRKG